MPPKNEKSSITEDLITALRDPRVADVIGGVINDKLRPLMEEISTLRAENSEQATKIVNLQNDLQLATSRIDELETFTRRDNLIISGLPLESYAEATGAADNDGHGESSECTEKTVLKLFNDQLKVSVTPADISIAHRLRKRGGGSTVNSGPPAAIIRFTNRKIRDKVFNARRVLRNVGARIFINEDLNSSTNKLFFQACQLVKFRSIYSAWSYTGFVFIKETSTSRPKRITSSTDLPAAVSRHN